MARTGSSSPPSTTPVSSTDKLVKSSSDNLARQKAAAVAAAAAAAAKRPQRPILDTLKKEELKSKAIKAHQKAQGMSQTMVVSLVMGAAAVLFALLLLLKSPAQTTSVDSRATLMKAVELLHGDGVRNEEKGMELLRKAADLGNAEAQHRMGYFYTVGNTIVEPDYTEAFKWFSLAANQGSSDSMVNLGLAYAQGNGVERSYENALSWWKKAAKRRNAMAMGHLGRCHEYGLGTEVDLQKAMAQYQQGAAMGDALSTYHLGNFYLKGMNTVKDPKKALEFFKQAYSKGYLLAATALGELHLRGEGVEKNLRTALGYFQQAAEKGEPTALYHVALAHDTNIDEKGDTITAGKENQFGIMYNPTMAFEAFERAANAGSSDAMFQMALNLESGAAGKIDSKEAYKWLIAAAQSGNPRAAYEMVNKNGSSEYGGLIELSDDQVDQMLRLALRSPDKNIKNEVIKLLDERSKGEEEEEDVEIVEEEVEA